MLEVAKGLFVVKSKIVSMRLFCQVDEQKNPNKLSQVAFQCGFGEKDVIFSEKKTEAECKAMMQDAIS
jgi:hypothetical protein